jgi:hypothetical protein
MPITDLESLRAPLVQTYGQLTAIEQSIVQLFSVIYEPVGRAAILTCVNQAKLHQGKAFTAVTFKPYLDKWNWTPVHPFTDRNCDSRGDCCRSV